MAGKGSFTHILGRACTGLTLCAIAGLLALAAPAGAATGGSAPPGGARAVTCPPTPATLSPGSFTLMIRIQQQTDVNTYTNHDEATGGLGDRIQPQDIFVIHTRFQKPTLTPADQMAEFTNLTAQLRTAFPNRIIALNGLSYNPLAPGYRYALAGQGVFAMLLDWESDDWTLAQSTAPLPPFTYLFPKSLKRTKSAAGALGATNSSIAQDVGTRAGIAPIDQSTWDYGQVAQAQDVGSRHAGGAHLGIQSVMTQESCRGGGPPFASRLATLLDQYKFRTVTKKVRRRRHGKVRRVKITKRVKIKKGKRPSPLNLAAQISFNGVPVPGDPLPIKAIGPATADQCVAAGLSTGITAYFFYASSDSMRLLYQQPTVNSLRPATGV